MGNVSMEARDINYRGGEMKMSVEDALKSTSGEAAAIAQLQTDVGNLQTTKANLITIAPVFSEETAYDPGDLVYYNGLTYRCVNAHEGEWDADDFAATTISNELDSLKSGLNDYNKKALIVQGHTPATYGDVTWDDSGVVYTGRYPVAFWVKPTNDTNYYQLTQAMTGMSVGMDTNNKLRVYVAAEADSLWKDADCFGVYI